MSDAGAKHREEAIGEIVLPVLDCACIDKRTRKILTYLVDKELKSLKTFPKVWVEGSIISLQDLKKKIEDCDLPRVMVGTKSGGRRPLSQFNLHMKECASSKEKGGLGLPFGECTELWKKKKGERHA